jgi:thiamine pyrophosphate-dependent acetolactate synthase large subunit-like protein
VHAAHPPPPPLPLSSCALTEACARCGAGALQDVNQIPVLAPLCKYVGRAERVADIPSVLVRAIEAAQEGVPGPVYVELPIDVLYDMGTVHKEITGNRRPARNLKDRFMAWYMNRYLRRVFAGSFDQLGRLAGPKARVRPAPPASAIAATLKALQRAQRPVMIVGAATAVDCEHIDATSAAVRSLGVPTFLSGAARGLAGRDCAHAFRQKRSDAVRESDCVLLVGALTDFRLNYGKGLPKNTIAVNLREKDVKLNQGLFWSAALNVVCDPGVFLRALADAVPSGTSSAWSAWVGKLQEREQEVEAANAKRSSEPTTEAHTLNAVFVAQEIEVRVR